MANPIKNIQTEGQVTASTANFRMTDEQVLKEIKKFPDRAAVAIFRSETATVIVSQLYPIDPNGKHRNPYHDAIDRADGLPSQDDGWPEG